jgi:uncharacterized protein (UPF0335 family)
VASAPRAAWRRIRTSLASQVSSDLEPVVREQIGAVRAHLEAIEGTIAALGDQVKELREIAGAQVEAENQSSELLGRLLRAATSRIEQLEERAERQR